MISPIIAEPVFVGSEYVKVHSLEAGSKVIVMSGQEQIGLAKASGGSVNVKLNRALTVKDVLTATSAKGGQTSNAAASVKVQQLPTPLPTPICLATLYAGARPGEWSPAARSQ
jgi:hypothetical protein